MSNCHVIVQRYYRNGCPDRYEYHYCQALADPGLNSPEKDGLTHNALYNVHEVAYDLAGFVTKITTYPDLIFVCGMYALEQELDKLLQSPMPSPQLLSYDITFQVGDSYLSQLLFRHTAFISSPVMLLIQERKKFQSANEEFMNHISAMIPTLSKSSTALPIVTDNEQGMCNAIDKHLPNLVCLKC